MSLRLGTSRLAVLFGAALVVALGVFAAMTLETFSLERDVRALRHSVASAELERLEADAAAAFERALLAGLAGVIGLAVTTGLIGLELIAERRVERLAERDVLTGLANRRLFQLKFEAALARHAREGTSFALIYLDVDQFKRINDVHTHVVGDEVLQSLAARLADSIRSDDVAARLGGDEFAVLLCGVPAGADTLGLAERVAEHIAAPYRLPHVALEIRCSFGISCCPSDGRDFNTLLMCADERMFARKLERRPTEHPVPEQRRQQDRPGEARQPPA